MTANSTANATPKTPAPRKPRRRSVEVGPGTAYVCPTCGATHIRDHRGQKFCSVPCYRTYWHEHVKQRAAAAGGAVSGAATRAAQDAGTLPRALDGAFLTRAAPTPAPPAAEPDETGHARAVGEPLPDDTPLGERSRHYADLFHGENAGATWAARGKNWATQLDDGSRILHLTGYGCRLSVEKEQLACRPGATHSASRGGDSETRYLRKGQRQIEAVVIGGHRGMISCEAIQWCCEQEVAPYITNRDAQLVTVVAPPEAPKIEQRRLQYSADPLTIAQAIVHRKVDAQAAARPELREFAPDVHREIDRAADVAELQRVEGRFSQAYWTCMRDLALSWRGKDVPDDWRQFAGRTSWNGTPRHATDPANAALNYAYAALAGRIEREITARGLDAAVGALHLERDGRRNSLTYDLIEALRSRVDVALFAWLSRQTLRAADFPTDRDGVVRLHPSLRKIIAQETHLPQRLITQELDHYVTLIRKAQPKSGAARAAS